MADPLPPPHAAGLLEPQSDGTGSEAGDSTYDEGACSTRSVTSSIFDYEREHGRTYHAFHAGKYAVPNDEAEQDRMDMMYHAVRMAIDDKLFYAPISNPTGILDVGTGSGIWAMDAADSFPGAEVIGIDLSPIQPNFVPPNLQFEVCDADDPWGFKPNRFDLIHTRIMIDYSLKSWPNFYQQAFDCLKPGGWVEHQEFSHHIRSDDDTIPEDSKMRVWEGEWTRGVQTLGLSGPPNPDEVARQMAEAGLINITKLNFKLPLGPWAKDQRLRQAGMFAMIMMLDGIHGLSIKLFTSFLGWSLEELDILLAQCRTELKKSSIHSYWPVHVIFGQKPPE